MWQERTEGALREREQRLRRGEQRMETQRKRILELRQENERLVAKKTRMDQENVTLDGNLVDIKQMLEMMAKHVGVVTETIRVMKEERISVETINEERDLMLAHMEENFNQLLVTDQVNIQRLEEEADVAQCKLIAGLVQAKEAVKITKEEISKLEKEWKELDDSEGALNDEMKNVLKKNENFNINNQVIVEKLNKLRENIYNILSLIGCEIVVIV